MIQPKLKQCSECEYGKLSVLWQSNPPLCRAHSYRRTASKHVKERKAIYPIKDDEMKVESIVDKDLEFYKFIWKKREHICAECGKELKEFDIDLFHHLLPKKKGHGGYPYFRHEEKNIVLLCGKFGCHGKAESAISYPKMKIFQQCENIKKQLLESVGIYYEPKTTIHERI